MGDRPQSPPVGLEDSSRLCNTCQAFQNSGIVYETRYSQLAISAQSGCDHCKWLELALFDQAYAELAIPDKRVSVERGFSNSIQICEIATTIKQDGWIQLEVYTPPGNVPIWQGLGHLKEPCSDPGSEEALRQIREWSEHCLQTHEACKQNELPQLPTRVVDIENTKEPRIIETHGVRGNYIAVSHCWGTEKGLTATSYNMSIFATKINPNALLKTFKDAILVSRALGITKIWIDSLCIIQDSLEDWKKESSKMWDIYRNAFVTVAAVGASGDAKGFLGPREFLSTVHSTPSGEKIAFRRHGHFGPIEPLYTRAWAFQERFLSSRMIEFKRQELQWHCRTLKSCECQQSDSEVSNTIGDALENLDFAYQSFMQGSLEEALNKWRRAIVQPYSGLLLTKESDRLPALSGIASMIKSRFPDEVYLSGIWSSDLSRGLQWICESPEHHSFSDTIPSWSWLIARGPIRHRVALSHSNDGKAFTKFVAIEHGDLVDRAQFDREASSQLTTPDYKGDLMVRAIRITGPLLSFDVSNCPVEEDVDSFVNKVNWALEILRLGHSAVYPDNSTTIGVPRRSGFSIELHLLLLETADNDRVYRCLLLHSGMHSGTYYRIGFVVLRDPFKFWFNQCKPKEIVLF